MAHLVDPRWRRWRTYSPPPTTPIKETYQRNFWYRPLCWVPKEEHWADEWFHLRRAQRTASAYDGLLASWQPTAPHAPSGHLSRGSSPGRQTARSPIACVPNRSRTHSPGAGIPASPISSTRLVTVSHEQQSCSADAWAWSPGPTTPATPATPSLVPSREAALHLRDGSARLRAAASLAAASMEKHAPEASPRTAAALNVAHQSPRASARAVGSPVAFGGWSQTAVPPTTPVSFPELPRSRLLNEAQAFYSADVPSERLSERSLWPEQSELQAEYGGLESKLGGEGQPAAERDGHDGGDALPTVAPAWSVIGYAAAVPPREAGSAMTAAHQLADWRWNDLVLRYSSPSSSPAHSTTSEVCAAPRRAQTASGSERASASGDAHSKWTPAADTEIPVGRGARDHATGYGEELISDAVVAGFQPDLASMADVEVDSYAFSPGSVGGLQHELEGDPDARSEHSPSGDALKTLDALEARQSHLRAQIDHSQQSYARVAAHVFGDVDSIVSQSLDRTRELLSRASFGYPSEVGIASALPSGSSPQERHPQGVRSDSVGWIGSMAPRRRWPLMRAHTA